MAGVRAQIKQADLARYIKAWRAAYSSEPRVEIRLDGTVILSATARDDGENQNDWD